MQKSLTILVADDEALIRMDLKEMLAEKGHKVLEAKDGAEAVVIAEANAIDLLILDIKMPGLDGLSALRQINVNRMVPAIMLTAYSQPELVSQAVDLGVFAYLVKPVKENDLLPALEVAIARADEYQALAREVTDLKESIEVRKLVERAKGVLMQSFSLSEPEAFRRIQKLSMDSRKSMREIAEAILTVGDLKSGLPG
ncbi:MAG: response regulator [Candidatus Sericytochromatia bacterium]|nr:response regulator [Candidatus Sericytochromatia bacterium]